MPIRPIDISRRLGIPKQTVNNYISQGMPLDTIEAAEAWYNSESRKGNKLSYSSTSIDDIDEQIKLQKKIVHDAYLKYEDKLKQDDPDCNKFYATYDKAAKTLREFEKSKDSQEIASQVYIKVDTAIQRFGAVTSQMREELNQLPTKLAPKVNPDSPGRAMKIIEDEVRKLLERMSSMIEVAEQAVLKDDQQEPLPVETDGPDVIEIPDNSENSDDFD